MKKHDVNIAEVFSNISLKQSQNISDTLYMALRDKIIDGIFPPDYYFPNETTFCEQLGIGRSSLREAYKALESNGFITRTKRGTHINSADVLNKAFSYMYIMNFSESDMSDLFEFRAALESKIAALAAMRATLENISTLRQCVDMMKQHSSDLEILTYHDTKFHIEMANASKNKMFINTMSMSSDVFFNGVYNAFHVDTNNNVQRAIQYHENILFAVEQKDSALAQNTMRSHIESVQKLLSCEAENSICIM
jgi:Transcriptional regulators